MGTLQNDFPARLILPNIEIALLQLPVAKIFAPLW